jgi:hypothetical protein
MSDTRRQPQLDAQVAVRFAQDELEDLRLRARDEDRSVASFIRLATRRALIIRSGHERAVTNDAPAGTEAPARTRPEVDDERPPHERYDDRPI